MSFCTATEFWWLVYAEGEGMFCLLCRQNEEHILQNKSKVFNKDPVVKFKKSALEEQKLCSTWRGHTKADDEASVNHAGQFVRWPTTNTDRSKIICFRRLRVLIQIITLKNCSLSLSRKRRLNGAVLRMRPEKPRSRVTAGVAR
jgi:hypothetical protein